MEKALKHYNYFKIESKKQIKKKLQKNLMKNINRVYFKIMSNNNKIWIMESIQIYLNLEELYQSNLKIKEEYLLYKNQYGLPIFYIY